MEKTLGICLIFILVFCLVAAENDWDSFNDSRDLGVGEEVLLGDDEGEEEIEQENVQIGSGEESSSRNLYRYTWNFYAALGVGVVGLLILIILVLAFVLRPRNRWGRK